MQEPDITLLIDAIVSLDDREEAKAFLRDLMTEAELQEFSRRLQAAAMLSRKVPYTTIAASTGLSTTTIARVSRWLNSGTGGYQKVLSKLGMNS